MHLLKGLFLPPREKKRDYGGINEQRGHARPKRVGRN